MSLRKIISTAQIISRKKSKRLFKYSTYSILIITATLPLFLYTAYTDFPISHEAPQYILRAQSIIDIFSTNPIHSIVNMFTNSRYPASIFILILAKILTPFSWPLIIVWITTLSHFLTGLVLSRWAFKFKGYPAAAIVLVWWPLTITLTRPLLNGWLAHLFSLTPAIYSIYSLGEKQYFRATAFFLLTFFFHPLSAFIVLLINAPLAIAQNLKQLNATQIVLTSTALIFITTGAFYWIYHNNYNSNMVASNTVNPLHKPFPSFYAIPSLAALFGLLAATGSHFKNNPHRSLTAYTFVIMSSILTFNHVWMKVGILELRFEPFFFASATLFGALGVANLIEKAANRHALRLPLLAAVAVPVYVTGLSSNTAFFQNNNNNPDLVPTKDERIAIAWIENNLPDNAHILTKDKMYYKWIPILTSKKWTGLQHNWPTYKYYFNQNHPIPARYTNYSHIVFFKQRELDMLTLHDKYSELKTIHENKTVLVKQFTK